MSTKLKTLLLGKSQVLAANRHEVIFWMTIGALIVSWLLSTLIGGY